MSRLKEILQEARTLTPAERAELAAMLLEQNARDPEAEEWGAGQRGLAAWSEAARSESWEPYYPASLKSGRKDAP